MNVDLELAKTILHEQDQVLALVKDGRVLGTGERQGVADLISLASQLGTQVQGAAVADRVVGKAAAMLARSMGISAVYAVLASEPGRQALAQVSVPFEYDELVPGILNRNKTGPCPFEQRVADLDDPHQAVQALLQSLQSQSMKKKL